MSNKTKLEEKFKSAYQHAVNIISRRNASGPNVKFCVGYDDINVFEESKYLDNIIKYLSDDEIEQMKSLAMSQANLETYEPRKDAAILIANRCRAIKSIKEKEASLSC